VGKNGKWPGSNLERCGSGQGLSGKDVTVGGVSVGKMWQWTGSKWERLVSGQGLSGKDVEVDRV
jgi:hypothetical protein